MIFYLNVTFLFGLDFRYFIVIEVKRITTTFPLVSRMSFIQVGVFNFALTSLTLVLFSFRHMRGQNGRARVELGVCGGHWERDWCRSWFDFIHSHFDHFICGRKRNERQERFKNVWGGYFITCRFIMFLLCSTPLHSFLLLHSISIYSIHSN